MGGQFGPQRTCLGCRKPLGKDDLVRYVLDPEGEVVVDYRQKLPGRGAYTCLTPNCVRAAVKRGQFERAFRGRNRRTDPVALLEEARRQLEEKVDSLIGMVRKAGMAIGGSNGVLAALEKGESLTLVLMARDISEGVGEKVRRRSLAADVPLKVWGDKSHLGRLFGREERSVVGVKQGGLASALEEGLKRYEQFVGEI